MGAAPCVLFLDEQPDPTATAPTARARLAALADLIHRIGARPNRSEYLALGDEHALAEDLVHSFL